MLDFASLFPTQTHGSPCLCNLPVAMKIRQWRQMRSLLHSGPSRPMSSESVLVSLQGSASTRRSPCRLVSSVCKRRRSGPLRATTGPDYRFPSVWSSCLFYSLLLSFTMSLSLPGLAQSQLVFSTASTTSVVLGVHLEWNNFTSSFSLSRGNGASGFFFLSIPHQLHLSQLQSLPQCYVILACLEHHRFFHH